MAVRTARGLKWSCTSCGSCCRSGYALGPVAPETIERLESLGIREHWPAAADGWHEPRTHPDGHTGAYLRAPDGACVFLMEDERCAIHSAFGAEAKPWFCQRFPLTPISDPNGVAVVVQPGCQGHHRVFESARALTEDDLQQAVDQTPEVHHATFDPAAVAVLPGRGVALDDWMYLEGRVLGALDEEQSPWEAVRRARDELAKGMPGGWPEADPVRAEAAAQGALRGFQALLQKAATEQGGGRPHRERVHATLDALARALAAEPGERPLTPEARRWLAVNLRSAVLGKRIHAAGSAVAGLGLFVVGVDLFSRAWPETPVPLAAFGAPWSMWHDLLGNRAMRAAVRVLTPALVDRVIRA